MKLLFLAALFFLSVSGLAAQPKASPKYVWPELDSLIHQLSSEDTSALAGIRKFVDSKKGNREERDSLIHYLAVNSGLLTDKESFELANRLNHIGLWLARECAAKAEILNFQLDIAFNYKFTDYADSCLYYLKMAEQYPIASYTPRQKTMLYNIKGIVSADESRHLEAIEWYQKALDQIEDKESNDAATIKENMGVLYLELRNYRRAIFHMQKAEKVFENTKDTIRLARLYSNLGTAYMRIDSLNKSAGYHLRAAKLAGKNSFGLARSLANYGNVLRRQGKLNEALTVMDSSLQICENLGISYGVFINLVNKSNVMLDLKNPEVSMRLLNEALQYPFANNAEVKLEIYEISARAYEMQGNLNKAFEFQKKYIALKASVEKEGADRIVMEWEENLLRERKDRELSALNLRLTETRQRHRMIIFASLMGLLLAFATALILYLRKQKQELRTRLVEEESETLRLQLELKERELTSQSIHLQAIGGFAEDISYKLGNLKQRLEGDKADELNRIIKDFENGIPEELWEDFRMRFEKVNEDFYQKLLQICPELTPVEIKIASFLRLNLSSKEISRLTNRSAGTISNTRSSLRKKLKLEEEDNLVAFLMSL